MPANYSCSSPGTTEQKRSAFMLPVIGILIILIISSYPVIADETSADKTLPPDEAFLLFIANLDSRGKQWISPLDFTDTESNSSNHPAATTNKKSSITPDEESNHD